MWTKNWTKWFAQASFDASLTPLRESSKDRNINTSKLFQFGRVAKVVWLVWLVFSWLKTMPFVLMKSVHFFESPASIALVSIPTLHSVSPSWHQSGLCHRVWSFFGLRPRFFITLLSYVTHFLTKMAPFLFVSSAIQK